MQIELANSKAAASAFFSAIDLHIPAVVLSWDLPPQN